MLPPAPSAPRTGALLALLLPLTLLGGCFTPTRDLVQRPLEPIGDDGTQIAVVDIHGEIADASAMPFGSACPPEEVILRLRAAGRDPHVKAIVLDLDTPGGDVTASDAIYRAVRAVRTQDHKPVIACMESVCASGGLYVACAADRIIALPTTLTGSIGVIFESPDLHELATRLGVQMTVITSGPRKDMGAPWRALTPEERAIIQTCIDADYAQFLGVVATGRQGHGPLPMGEAAATDRLRPLADGRILSGAQALAAGLVDASGTLFDAITEAGRQAHLHTTPQVIRYERDNGIFGFGASAPPVHVNAGVEIHGSELLPSLHHARMAYRWSAW